MDNGHGRAQSKIDSTERGKNVLLLFYLRIDFNFISSLLPLRAFDVREVHLEMPHRQKNRRHQH
jgi:hypothetical protein